MHIISPFACCAFIDTHRKTIQYIIIKNKCYLIIINTTFLVLLISSLELWASFNSKSDKKPTLQNITVKLKVKKQTDRQTDGETDRQMEQQTDKDSQADIEMNTQHNNELWSFNAIKHVCDIHGTIF